MCSVSSFCEVDKMRRMSKNKEKKMSALGLIIAKATYSDDMLACSEISFGELRELEKRFDFFVWVKAYMHQLSADRNYEEFLSLSDAIGIVMLSALTPQKQNRESVLELLSAIGIIDNELFLIEYEELHHDRFWVSELDHNE